MKLMSLSIAWVVGVYLGSLLFPPPYVLIPASVLALLTAVLWRSRAVVLWGGLCVAALMGLSWVGS